MTNIEKVNNEVVIRTIKPEDSIAELTTVLHNAYKKLKDMGLEYLAPIKVKKLQEIELTWHIFVT